MFDTVTCADHTPPFSWNVLFSAATFWLDQSIADARCGLLKVSTYERNPNPVSEERNPNPVSEERNPNPVSEERNPNPVSEERNPNPVSEERNPNPVS
ncbi:unnamed protein product [Boreogadus saida]